MAICFLTEHDITAVRRRAVTYLLIYLLTPWSRFLLQQLTCSQLVKKFPTFYGTRKFITAFTNARHLSLYWASSIQFIPPHPTSWRSILILSSHLRLGLPSGCVAVSCGHRPHVTHQLRSLSASSVTSSSVQANSLATSIVIGIYNKTKWLMDVIWSH
jgi:hypothetical protein